MRRSKPVRALMAFWDGEYTHGQLLKRLNRWKRGSNA